MQLGVEEVRARNKPQYMAQYSAITNDESAAMRRQVYSAQSRRDATRKLCDT